MIPPLALAMLMIVSTCPPGEPGTVLVVGGGLESIQFTVQERIDCRLNYDIQRLALWFDAEQTYPALPNTTFQSPPAGIDHGDMNGDAKIDGADIQLFVDVLLGVNTDPDLISEADFNENGFADSADVPPFVVSLLVGVPNGDVNHDGKVDGADIQAFVNVLLGGYDAEADLDSSGTVDLADIPLFVEVLLFGMPPPASTVTLFAEGLSASTSLCDTPVNVLTDPNGTGTFTLAETRDTTVMAFTVSPTNGTFGTPVYITMSPAIVPLVFDSSTSAAWVGVFQPAIGPASGSISMAFSPTQFRETSSGQAVLILGDSSFSCGGGIDTVALPGALQGSLTIQLAGRALSRNAVNLTPTSGPLLTAISYDQQDAHPYIGPTPASLEVVMTGNGNGAAETLLAGLVLNHLAVVMEVDRNGYTQTEAPSNLTVRLISKTSAGEVLQSVDSLTLARDDPMSSPSKFLYHSDFAVPIVLTDAPLDPNNYTLVLPVHATDQGQIVILPGGC